MTEICSAMIFKSPLGNMYLAEFNEKLIAVSVGKMGENNFQQILSYLNYEPRFENKSCLLNACKELDGYFLGERRDFSLPFKLHGTTFQKRIWKVLLKIPFGEVWSYGDVAKAAGRPNGARAVGQAVGANRLPIIIPCHRVVAANKKLGGFGCGLDVKRFLLNVEGVEGYDGS